MRWAGKWSNGRRSLRVEMWNEVDTTNIKNIVHHEIMQKRRKAESDIMSSPALACDQFVKHVSIPNPKHVGLLIAQLTFETVCHVS